MKRFFLFSAMCLVPAGSVLKAAELKIAVVDLNQAFMAYKQRAVLQKEIDDRKKKMNEELSRIEQKLKNRKSDLETLQPGTDKYRELQYKLIELETLLQVTKRQFELELEKAQRAHMERLLGDLDKVVKDYAREKGIDLVLAKYIASPRNAGPIFIALYNKPELDITAQIVERLNRDSEK